MTSTVIVGASAGGLATAESLRRLGYQDAITVIGSEPHLPYDRPPLSKKMLTGDCERTALYLRARSDLDSLTLDLRLGVAATGLDLGARVVSLADGTTVDFDNLVVATGIRPRRLANSDSIAGVHQLRTVEDAVGLRDRLRPGTRLVIVGAGFVGLEVAAAATELGVDVILLEAGPGPLAQAVGTEVGSLLSQTHLDRGVRVVSDIRVARLVGSHEVTGVELVDGTVVPADDVLVAIGSEPNTQWLDGSGLAIGNGLVCNDFCEAAPGVFGVGDVAHWHNHLFETSMRIEHRTNASEQGLSVARNIVDPGARRPYEPVPYFWSDQFGTKIQAYGYLRGHDEALIVDQDPATRRLLVAYRTGDRLVGVLAVGIGPKLLRSWRGLIGARTDWHSAVGATAR